MDLVVGKLYMDKRNSCSPPPLLRKEVNEQVGAFYSLDELRVPGKNRIILLFVGKVSARDRLSYNCQYNRFYKFLWGNKFVYIEDRGRKEEYGLLEFSK